MLHSQLPDPVLVIALAEPVLVLALVCLAFTGCRPEKDIGSHTDSTSETVGAMTTSVSTSESGASEGSDSEGSDSEAGTSTGPGGSTTTTSTLTSDAMTSSGEVSSTGETTSTTGTSGGPSLPMGGDEERKVVFITDDNFTGDFGGLDGADATCQGAAMEAGLSGTYRAWLSDETGSPSTRFIQSVVPYVRLDGESVANDWQDLIDGELAAAVDLTEKGNAPGGNVFTNTGPNGTIWNGLHCMSWTLADSPTPGNGFPPNTDETWTQGGAGSNCFDLLHIYCFEQ